MTNHGTTVARITGIDRPSALDRLLTEGVIELPSTSRHWLPDPVVSEDPSLSLSKQVVADRG